MRPALIAPVENTALPRLRPVELPTPGGIRPAQLTGPTQPTPGGNSTAVPAPGAMVLPLATVALPTSPLLKSPLPKLAVPTVELPSTTLVCFMDVVGPPTMAPRMPGADIRAAMPPRLVMPPIAACTSATGCWRASLLGKAAAGCVELCARTTSGCIVPAPKLVEPVAALRSRWTPCEVGETAAAEDNRPLGALWAITANGTPRALAAGKV